jgi:riboflavin-specific deaminase-like protein
LTSIIQGIYEKIAWQFLLALRRHVQIHSNPFESIGFSFDEQGLPIQVPLLEALIVLGPGATWIAHIDISEAAAQLFDLYLPICLASANQPLTLAHLGQSLDGRIATEGGASCYVTGPANIVHLHRMRALCDVVLVGSTTVRSDNPRLTTRRVEGSNPVRVVLDTQLRLHTDFEVFKDNASPTLVFCDTRVTKKSLGQAQIIGVPTQEGKLSLATILEQLHKRGLYAVFIEGGGITVSRFLQAGLLDRLQVAVAPLLIGSGRPSITLPAIEDLNDGLRPQHRLFIMGEDVLFDCVLH